MEEKGEHLVNLINLRNSLKQILKSKLLKNHKLRFLSTNITLG